MNNCAKSVTTIFIPTSPAVLIVNLTPISVSIFITLITISLYYLTIFIIISPHFHCLHHHPELFNLSENMAISRPKAKTSNTEPNTTTAIIAPVERPNSESLSEHQQALLSAMVDLPSGAPPSKDQDTLESISKDQQPAEDPGTDLPVEEVSKNPPAMEDPEDQPNTENLSKDQQSAENPTAAPPASGSPPKAPPVGEPLTTPPQLVSSSNGQPTTEVQAGDRQSAECITTNLQRGRSAEDPQASESFLESQSTAEGPTTDLPEGEIPKEQTESSFNDQSTAERLSEDQAEEVLAPTAEALLCAQKLSGKISILTFHVISNTPHRYLSSRCFYSRFR